MFGLYAPGLDVLTHGIARDFKLFDDGLVVVLNKRCYQMPDGTFQPRWEIYDRNAPGGPKWQLVMRVPLREDGSVRPPDRRDLEAVMKARGRSVEDLMDELERRSEKRDQAVQAHVSNLASAMADDLKYVGRRVITSVEWRDRTDPAMRERIRQVAA